MWQWLLVVVSGLCLVLNACAAEPRAYAAPDFVVSPQGNDAWSGVMADPNARRSDGPFATLERARPAVRALKLAQPDRQTPIVVMLRGGLHRLDQTFVLEPEDSGTAAAPVVYAAFPGEKPVLSGGVLLTGFRAAADGKWAVRLPEVAAGQWDFRQLFVNGERRFRPRLPKEGYFFTAAEVPPTQKSQGKGSDRLRYETGDVDPAWRNLNDIEVMTFHQWFTSILRIDSIDAQERLVNFTGRTPSLEYYAKINAGQRYVVENVAEALRDPGQWYLDRKSGVLTYIPLPGEKPERTTVIAPKVQTLVKLAGDPGAGRWVEHIRFEGLTFADSHWTTSPQGYAQVQAAVTMPAAIQAVGAQDCAIVNCTVTRTGGWAIDFGQGCAGNRVANCELTDLGAGGIKIGTTAFSKDDAPEHTWGQIIRNNLIAHGGRQNPGAIGIWIGQSSRNLVEHNDIADFYYSGMSIGWTWGYGNSGAHHNVVQYNHIHHLGYGVLSDMGGIYTLGVSPGSVLRRNYIHDVFCIGYGGWGIYFDEGTTGMLAEKNLIERCTDGNFHQHYGKENLFTNNILIDARDNQIAMSRVEPHLSFTFARNIVAWIPGVLFRGDPDNFKADFDHNVYWHGGKAMQFGKKSFEEWQAGGKDQGSVVADPLFVDAKAGDYRLKPDSPALKLGFVPFHDEIAKAGRLNKPPYNPPAGGFKLIYPGPPAPRPVRDGFEDTAVGQKPGRAMTHEDTPQGTIRVTDETAASGNRSLKFTDAPDQKFPFNPHMYYQPGFRKGVMRGSFALRYDGGTALNHEWRTGGQPYQTGPSINISPAGEVSSRGKKLADLPLKQWIVFEITAGLGDKADGKWSMTVKLPDGKTLKFADLPCDKGFDHAAWVGFVTASDAAGTFYIDDVVLEAK